MELWNAGDWESVFAYYDDDVVFEDMLLPDGDTYRGLEAVRNRVAELRDVAGEWRVHTETLIDAGADVVWINRVTGKRDDDTPPYAGVVGVVFSFEGGRVVRLRWYSTPEKAMEAVGLSA